MVEGAGLENRYARKGIEGSNPSLSVLPFLALPEDAMQASQLSAKTCVPCKGGEPPLPPDRVREYLSAVPQWSLGADGKRIRREFKFKDFVAAMRFVNRVADLAESEGHHPDITIHWNRVTLELWTHAIGGLHENDFVMAAKIDALG